MIGLQSNSRITCYSILLTFRFGLVTLSIIVQNTGAANAYSPMKKTEDLSLNSNPYYQMQSNLSHKDDVSVSQNSNQSENGSISHTVESNLHLSPFYWLNDSQNYKSRKRNNQQKSGRREATPTPTRKYLTNRRENRERRHDRNIDNDKYIIAQGQLYDSKYSNYKSNGNSEYKIKKESKHSEFKIHDNHNQPEGRQNQEERERLKINDKKIHRHHKIRDEKKHGKKNKHSKLLSNQTSVQAEKLPRSLYHSHHNGHTQQSHENGHLQPPHDYGPLKPQYGNGHLQPPHENAHLQPPHDIRHLQPSNNNGHLRPPPNNMYLNEQVQQTQQMEYNLSQQVDEDAQYQNDQGQLTQQLGSHTLQLGEEQQEVTMLTEGQVYVISQNQQLELRCEFDAPEFEMFDNPVVWKKRQKQETFQINIMGNIFEPFLETNRFEVGFLATPPSTYCLTLRMENLTFEDSGNYTCEVRGRKSVVLQSVTHYVFVRAPVRSMSIQEISMMNSHSKPFSHFHLTVSDISSHQTPSSDPRQIVFVENQPRSLTCEAKGGYPVPHINLYLGDRDVTEKFKIFSSATLTGIRGLRRIETQTERRTEGLTVTAEDDGQMIRCVAVVPGHSPNSTSVLVSVHYGPVISCSSRTADVGEEKVFISCDVRARPDVTSLFWIIDVNGTTLSGGEVSNEYWSVVMDKGGGVLESKLFMRRALEESFRTYTIVSENSVATTSQHAQLQKKFIPTPPPRRVVTPTAAPSVRGGGGERKGRHQTEQTFFRSVGGPQGNSAQKLSQLKIFYLLFIIISYFISSTVNSLTIRER